MNDDLSTRYDAVRQRVDDAARRAGRDGSEVTIVAVTKTFPADVIAAAATAGITDIGESRAQELKEKFTFLGDRVTWHFIGHLQTNKVRQVVGIARLIHSVDRFGVAEAIAHRCEALAITQDVLIEVNIGREGAKHGADPAQAVALAEGVASLPGIEVRGAMAMAPFTDDPADARPFFSEMRELSEQLVQVLPGATELSLGMTRDFELAVEEGATIVRVGEAIFGPRNR